MRIMDSLSRLLRNQSEEVRETQNNLLSTAEIRLILDGSSENLSDFAASHRLHWTDPKGDTPLHLAARSGNLALCDLFVRAGADPAVRNHEHQSPADVALAGGHSFAARLLFSLSERSRNTEPNTQPEDHLVIEASGSTNQGELKHTAENVEISTRSESLGEFDELLGFEVEEEAEIFFERTASEAASGNFAALASHGLAVNSDEDSDWEIDLSPAIITGDGIGAEVAVDQDQGGEHDFLKVRNRGRASVKRAVVQSSTLLSIDPGICQNWATEFLNRGWFSYDDIETIIALCEGNGDPEDLRANLNRCLEAAGLELIDDCVEDDIALWDARSEVSSDELAEAIEATLTRATRLPGTRRFFMDKADEARLLEPMVRAKQDLQLSILACEPAVEAILDVIDQLQDGSAEPGYVTLKSVYPARRDHHETAVFFEAADTLSQWHGGERIMDGKHRREVLKALGALDLSVAFCQRLVRVLAEHEGSLEASARLDGLISVYESATERLILEHLPYARRFAARNVEDGEDPEDVFQVAFIGLQRSTRRFDPERGHRFTIYSTYWMKQTLTRWRADEGAEIRIPVHRHEKLAKLDRALQRLDLSFDRGIPEDVLAVELGWSREEVRTFRQFPREAIYLEDVDAWEGLLPEVEDKRFPNQAEIESVVADLLSELDNRQAEVIRLRFGIDCDDELTLEEIGQIYGVTRERIRQIEKKGLDTLSHPGRKRRLQAVLGV